MKLLLDTHVFLWWLQDSSRLPPAARDLIASDQTSVFVSAVCIWEIAIKASLAKLSIAEHPEERLEIWIALCGFTELPVTARHAAAVRDLPFHHADPFDRLLVSQARSEPLTLMTADPTLASYDVPLWRI